MAGTLADLAGELAESRRRTEALQPRSSASSEILQEEPPPEPMPAERTEPRGSLADLARELAGQKEQRLRASAQASAEVKPDQAGEALALERSTGIPRSVVLRNPDAARKQAHLAGFDGLMAHWPKTAEALSDQDFSAVASDEIDRLKNLERFLRADYSGDAFKHLKPLEGPKLKDLNADEGLWQVLKNAYENQETITAGLRASFGIGLRKAYHGLTRGSAEFGERVSADMRARADDEIRKYGGTSIALPPETPEQLRERANAAAAGYRAAMFDERATTPQFESWTAQGLYGGAQSLLQIAPGIAVSVVTGTSVPALTLMGLQTFGTSYGDLREDGVSANVSLAAALGQAAFEVVPEIPAMKFLVRGFGRLGTGKMLAGFFGREFASELISTHGGDLVEAVAKGIDDPDKLAGEWEKYVSTRVEQTYKTFLATVVMSGSIGAANSATRGALTMWDRMTRDSVGLSDEFRAAGQSLRGLGIADEVLREAEAMKTRERDPNAFRAHVQELAKGSGLEYLYIDGVLMQSAIESGKIKPEQMSAMVADQVEDAAIFGGTVAIPIGEYAGYYVGTPADQELRPFLRTHEEGMTKAEAETVMANQTVIFEQAAGKALSEHITDTPFRVGLDVVENHFREQLAAVNRFSPVQNEAYVQMQRAFYATLAHDTGTTPDMKLKEYQLQIQTEQGTVDLSLSQGAPALSPEHAQVELDAVVAGIKAKYGLPTFGAWFEPIMDKDGIVTGEGNRIYLAKIEVPAELRGGGIGTAAIEELLAYADMRGYEVKLHPAPFGLPPGADMGAAYDRLVRLYERLGFETSTEPGDTFMLRRRGLDFTVTNPMEGRTIDAAIDGIFFDVQNLDRYAMAEALDKITQTPQFAVAMTRLDEMAARGAPGEEGRPMLLLHEGDDRTPTVWLLGWRKGDETPIHDHDDSEVAVKIVRGTVFEKIYAPGHAEPYTTREFSAGGVITIPTPYIHSVGNDSHEGTAVTLHVYYPQLDKMRFFEETGTELPKTGEWDGRKIRVAPLVKTPDATEHAYMQDGARKAVKEKHTRIGTTGRIVGSPDWIPHAPPNDAAAARAQVKAMRQLKAILRKLAIEGEAGKFWYENSGRAVLNMFGNDVKKAAQFMGLIAIYSQRTSVAGNTTMALNAWFQWQAGVKDIQAGGQKRDAAAIAWLERGEDVSGIKRNSFWQNLMAQIDKSALTPGVSTIDMWMLLAFDYGSTKGPPEQYRFAELEIKSLAEELGWAPHQAQAAIWTAIKARIENIPDWETTWKAAGVKKESVEYYRLATQLGLRREVTDAEIKSAATDYSDLLHERSAQISFESAPSEDSGVLPGYHTATASQKAEYHAAVQAALTGPKGEDLIAEAVGLPQGHTLTGHAAWKGEVTAEAGGQTFVAVHVGGVGPERGVTSIPRKLLNLAAALHGYVKTQDAVPWHHPVYDGVKKNGNGIDLRARRALTAPEMKDLYARIVARFGRTDLAPAYTANGARVLNFAQEQGLSNVEYQKGMQEIIASLPEEFGGGNIEVGVYRSDGEYISNDWKEHRDGEGYLEILAKGAPDLQERARALRNRVASVNERFAEKYGWNSASLAQRSRSGQSVLGGKDGAAGAGDVGKARRAALERVPDGYSRRAGADTPLFSARRGKHPVAFVGYHFGNTPGLKTLDGNKFGTGAPSQERERISSFAKALNKRVYFYLGREDGVLPQPEAIVASEGGNVYRAIVDNIYDFNADPENLIADWRKLRSSPEALQRGIHPMTLLEAMVIQAGYDGYYNEQSNGLVVLGHDAVPVEALGNPAEAAEAVAKEAGQMTQDGEQRGAIAFPSNIASSPSVITLLANADFSTFVHESGHFFLEVMLHEAGKSGASPEIRARVDTIMKWLGVSVDAFRAMTLAEKRPYHEQFARGFEAYMMEGKAPSADLRGLFQQFRNWLVNVYRTVEALDVQLTPEVRGAFDRMLATEDLIVQNEIVRGFAPLFKSIEQSGMTPEQWKEYQALPRKATDEAMGALERASLRDMAWTRLAHSRALKAVHKDVEEKRAAVREEVQAKLEEQPVYRAQKFFKTGVLEGAEVEGEHRLSLAKLREMYGDHPAAPWRYIPTGKYSIVTAKGGLDPKAVATMFGFKSADHMIREIVAAEPIKNMVEIETDRVMLERHGDLTSPEALKRKADAAVANEVRTRHVATELRALTRAVGPTRLIEEAAKAAAENLIGKRNLQEIRPDHFRVMAKRAAKAAEAALARGDTIAAAEAKRAQLVGIFGEKIANEARETVAKNLRRFQRALKSETIDKPAQAQIRRLLARFNLAQPMPETVTPQDSLETWIERAKGAGYNPDISAKLQNETFTAPFRNLSFTDFEDLSQAVFSMEHIGRSEHKLLVAGDRAEFKAAVAQGRDTIAENSTGPLPESRAGQRGLAKGLKKAVKWAQASHRKFSSLVRQMDGFKEGGFLWNLLVRPMNAAGDFEVEQIQKARKEMYALINLLATGSGKRLLRDIHVPEVGKSYSREEIIGIALNMGNAINKERVLSGEKTADGQPWTQFHLDAVLSHLDAADLQQVQKIWDYLDSFRPMIAAKQMRVNGTEPKWVKAEPVTINGVELQGGYWPIKYDPERSERSNADDAASIERMMTQGHYTSATTERGHLEERVKSTNRAMRYDFVAVLQQHVDQVIHDLAWHEFLIDANRLIGARGLANTIREHYGPEFQNALSTTLRDIAIGHYPAQEWVDKTFRYLNKGVSIAGLGWNLVTAAQQPLGLTQSAQRIGTWNVLRGLGQWIGSAVTMENKVKEIYAKSTFMKNRGETFNREVNELLNTVTGKPGGFVQASYFYFIQTMQMVADVPTWLGQYDAMIRAGKDEAEAIALADQAVIDSQGSGMIKDLASVQRGSDTKKAFTVFYSFFNTTYNLSAEEHAKVGRNPWTFARLVPAYLLLFVVPATASWMLKEALKGGGDWPEDEDKLLERLITENLSYMLNTVVLLREISQTIVGFRDYQGPAGTRFFASLAKFLKQVSQGEIDEAMLRAARETAGPLLHLPTAQVMRIYDAIRAMMEGEDVSPWSFIGGVPQEQKVK